MASNPVSPPDPLAAFDLTGKVAVITGGSRGLGLAMAEAFAAQGATVVIASRKLEACEAAAARIAAATGAESIGLQCHVGDWQACTALVETVIERFGRIDVFVNNAGMSPLYDTLGSISEALFDKVIDVNLKGPFRLSALVAEHMAAGEGGSIINVSSVAASQPSRAEIPYAAAKAALNTMTVGLAHMFGPKVRANVIQPGPFLTDISKAWDMPAFEEQARRSIPLQRGGRPEEIIGAALYLASEASSYTTGSVIKIDGGMTW
jgi:NAD(P)-dependent dehydrogenase (short-subunit alcohol dehydrogenase family)